MNINFVRQTTDNNCVLACVAMVTNTPLHNVIEFTEKMNIKIPVESYGEYKLLARFGCWYIPNLHNELFPNKTYMITVPSLNFPGLNHRITVQTDETKIKYIFDPQRGRTVNGIDKKCYTINSLLGWSEALEVYRI